MKNKQLNVTKLKQLNEQYKSSRHSKEAPHYAAEVMAMMDGIIEELSDGL